MNRYILKVLEHFMTSGIYNLHVYQMCGCCELQEQFISSNLQFGSERSKAEGTLPLKKLIVTLVIAVTILQCKQGTLFICNNSPFKVRLHFLSQFVHFPGRKYKK